MDNKQAQINHDYVCPVCFKPVSPRCCEGELITQDGIRRRSYSVWCPECSLLSGNGSLVIQYYHGGRWRIEKHIAIKPLYVFDSEWQQIGQPVPENEIPLIQTGPGGDFAVRTTNEKMAEALKSYDKLLEQLSSCGHLIRDILLNHKSV